MMKSPFPGMDPYLEAHWDILRQCVLASLKTKLENHCPEGWCVVIERNASSMVGCPAYISIKKVASLQIGTIIYVLDSLSKSDEFHASYQQNKQAVVAQGINVVEIDLLRSGNRTIVPHLSKSDKAPYQVCVYWAGKPSGIEVFVIPFYLKLPRIPVPLYTPENKFTIDLQEVIEECYPRDNCDFVIDYLGAPVPPFTPKDAIWADNLLREKGIRGE